MTYNEASHTYRDGDTIIPSVTQVLAPSNKWYTPGSAEKGVAVHEVCAKWAAAPGLFLHDEYVDSFILWHYSHNPRLLLAEQMFEAEINGLRFAGRYDLLFQMNQQKVLVDIKTGRKANWHQAQIAAYSIACKPARAIVLYLHDDMTYTETVVAGGALAAGILIFEDKLRKYYDQPVQGS